MSLAWFESRYPIEANSPPRFSMFPTITSHLPFEPVPPYQPDWQRLLTPEPFDPAKAEQALLVQPDWLDLVPGYVNAINYTYRWLAGYVGRPTARPDLMLVIGDHQPASSVTGPGASWNVPVHVITANPLLIERLAASGFVRGMTPAPASLGPMHELTPLLNDLFAGEDRRGRFSRPDPDGSTARLLEHPSADPLPLQNPGPDRSPG